MLIQCAVAKSPRQGPSPSDLREEASRSDCDSNEHREMSWTFRFLLIQSLNYIQQMGLNVIMTKS
jgi:hypothetical protein